MATKTPLLVLSIAFVVLGAGATLGACAHRTQDPRSPAAADYRAARPSDARGDARNDAKDDRRADRGERPGPGSRGDWRKLGERWVEGTRDRDVIEVGRDEGRYRRMMIVVENSAVEMHDILVTFGDGSRFSPPTRVVFSPQTRSRVIDFPGDARFIRTVEFRYGNLPGGGRAQVELWAQ